MNIVTVAVIIVAATLAALAALISGRAVMPGWVTIGVAILVALLVFAAGPAVLGG
jgi:hypothetical protein